LVGGDEGTKELMRIAERTVGGLDVFLPYVRDYVDTFSGKSITTAQWKEHLYGFFEKNGGAEKIKALDSIDWNVRPISILGLAVH
jgi:leukotriene-A4 hydrolase